MSDGRRKVSGMEELGRVMRVVRTLLLASTSLGLAAIAHSMGGGPLPGPGTTAVLGVLAIFASCLVAGTRPRLWVLIPFLTALQFLLHQALTWSGAATVGAGGVVPAPHAGHAGHGGGHVVGGTGEPIAVVASGAAAHHATDPGMLSLHGVAILVTALLMVIGERTARAALHVLGHVVPSLTVPITLAVVRPRIHPATATPATPHSVRVARATPRRGPPALA